MATAPETILVVEDDPAIRMGLELNLHHEGYRLQLANGCAEGLDLVRHHTPDLVVLDLMLPDGSGLDLLRQLRHENHEMPVLVLTALGQQEDIVRGLRQGADDYLTKPFAVAELLARIGAALRRQRQRKRAETHRRLCFGPLVIDREARAVTLGPQTVRLTSREYELLLVLAERPGRVLSRQQLLEAVWGYDYEGTARTVDTFVYSLRSKLEADPAAPRYIKTVHGVGYVFGLRVEGGPPGDALGGA